MLSNESLYFNEMEIKKYQYSAGRTGVLIICINSDKSLNISIYGGESPHIGAVVMALPRDSLRGNGMSSSDCFILPVPGHKDYLVASKVAHEVASRTHMVTVVSVGIHNENITQQEITAILCNVDNSIMEIIKEFSLCFD